MKKILSITALSFALFVTSCQTNSSSGKVGSDLNANKTEKKNVSNADQSSTTTTDKCQGSRQIGCTCPQGINYVCGCNGVTYDNGCEATCDGVVSYTFGRCPGSDEVNKSGTPK